LAHGDATYENLRDERKTSEAETRERAMRRRRGRDRENERPAKDDATHLPALMIRLAIGPTMFVHGYNKVFGSGGIEGTQRWFGSIGFRPAAVHARMAAATEMTSGALMTLGAANPLPSAAVIGVMTVAARSDHRGKGFFVFKGGWEYVAVLSAVVAALAGMGPGRWSVDHLIGNHRRGWKAAFAALALGVGSGAAVLKGTFDPEREAEPADTTEPTTAEQEASETGTEAQGTAASKATAASS
jgi:putative oxidoreductase